MVRVSVVGATGYTGFELVKILLKHPHVKISFITSESSAGEIFSDLYPALTDLCDQVLVGNDYDKIAAESDAVFLCLPHGASMDAAAYLYKKGKIVFDLSADYRLSDKELYESAYKIKHNHPELLSKAAYGLAEINKELVKSTNLVAVPGCYPTSILIPLLPLIKEGVIEADSIISDSKSGVSGAGKKATATTHYCEANEDLKPYSIFTHRHKPEIDHILGRFAGTETDILFTPHLVPVTRGMVSTIYVRSNQGLDDIKSIWKNYYGKEPCVRLFDKTIPAMKHVANTPFIDIAAYQKGDKVIIVSALDNLLKGASSQAVQCFNLRMGFDMGAGLI